MVEIKQCDCYQSESVTIKWLTKADRWLNRQIYDLISFIIVFYKVTKYYLITINFFDFVYFVKYKKYRNINFFFLCVCVKISLLNILFVGHRKLRLVFEDDKKKKEENDKKQFSIVH